MTRPASPSPAGPPSPACLVVVVKGYPRLSETFVAHELAALERRGLRLAIVSLRQPYDATTHPVHAAIHAPVLYLPEYLWEAPRRVLRGQLSVFTRAPGRYLRSLAVFLHDLARDPTPNRVRRFGQAGVLARELPPGAAHLHAHFLHTPASVARYAAIMVGLGWSVSAHAKDVWTRPVWELREKLAAARFAVTCTAGTRAYLRRLAPGARISLVYHGLDRTFFAPPLRFGSPRDGGDPANPVRLLAVARFQPKKGLDVLLEAVARVARHVSLTIVGYGPLEGALRAQAAQLRPRAPVRFAGALDQQAVRDLYRTSDLFVLSPRVAADGDRDGLPNVLVEALSQGLPVVATRVAAIPELVDDGEQGRLVSPEDPSALAGVIDGLAADPALRQRLGENGIRRVREGFDVEVGIDRLLVRLAEVGAPLAARDGASAPAGG